MPQGARAEDIRNRLVRIAVASGIRLMEQGDTTGALPWFAEALMFDRHDPDADATHRLRIGTLLDQCPSLDGLFAHGRPINWATLDPSGRRLVTAAATARPGSGTSPPASALTPPLPHDGPVHRAEFRGDGRRLVTASDDGDVRVWDLDAGRRGRSASAPAPACGWPTARPCGSSCSAPTAASSSRAGSTGRSGSGTRATAGRPARRSGSARP